MWTSAVVRLDSGRLRVVQLTQGGGIANDCEDGFYAQYASTISAPFSSALNCTSAGYTALDSNIDCEGANASGSNIGLRVLRGGRMTAFGVTAANCIHRAASVQNGSTLSCDGGSDFSGCVGAISVECLTGSNITARDANITNSAGVAFQCSQSQGTVTGANYTGSAGNKVEVFSGAWVIAFSSSLAPSDTNVASFTQLVGLNGIVWA